MFKQGRHWVSERRVHGTWRVSAGHFVDAVHNWHVGCDSRSGEKYWPAMQSLKQSPFFDATASLPGMPGSGQRRQYFSFAFSLQGYGTNFSMTHVLSTSHVSQIPNSAIKRAFWSHSNSHWFVALRIQCEFGGLFKQASQWVSCVGEQATTWYPGAHETAVALEHATQAPSCDEHVPSSAS